VSDTKTEYVDYGWLSAEPEGAAPYVNRAIDRLIDPSPGSRVLDVGCGNGYLAARFAARGCLVVGIDLSESGIAMARRHFPQARFEVAAADDHMLETLDEDPFDYIVSTEVIEHLYAPDSFVKGMFAALRDGGTAVISTPYHGYVKNLALALTAGFDSHWHPSKRGGHIKFWSRRSLIGLLREAGFANCEFRGAGRIPYLWKSMVIAARRPAA